MGVLVPPEQYKANRVEILQLRMQQKAPEIETCKGDYKNMFYIFISGVVIGFVAGMVVK